MNKLCCVIDAFLYLMQFDDVLLLYVKSLCLEIEAQCMILIWYSTVKLYSAWWSQLHTITEQYSIASDCYRQDLCD